MRSYFAATLLVSVSFGQASAQLARVSALNVGSDGITMSIFSSSDLVFSEGQSSQVFTLPLPKENFPARDLSALASLGDSKFVLQSQVGSISLNSLNGCRIGGEVLGHGVIRVSVLGCRSDEATSADARSTLFTSSYLGGSEDEEFGKRKALHFETSALPELVRGAEGYQKSILDDLAQFSEVLSVMPQSLHGDEVTEKLKLEGLLSGQNSVSSSSFVRRTPDSGDYTAANSNHCKLSSLRTIFEMPYHPENSLDQSEMHIDVASSADSDFLVKVKRYFSIGFWDEASLHAGQISDQDVSEALLAFTEFFDNGALLNDSIAAKLIECGAPLNYWGGLFQDDFLGGDFANKREFLLYLDSLPEAMKDRPIALLRSRLPMSKVVPFSDFTDRFSNASDSSIEHQLGAIVASPTGDNSLGGGVSQPTLGLLPSQQRGASSPESAGSIIEGHQNEEFDAKLSEAVKLIENDNWIGAMDALRSLLGLSLGVPELEVRSGNFLLQMFSGEATLGELAAIKDLTDFKYILENLPPKEKSALESVLASRFGSTTEFKEESNSDAGSEPPAVRSVSATSGFEPAAYAEDSAQLGPVAGLMSDYNDLLSSSALVRSKVEEILRR